MPLVSVIIPVFRVEKFVAAALSSVLTQTFTDFEVLVIDDCSPDKSADICRDMADERVRIIRHEKNRGLAGARNTGIREARGEYLAFLDSDDIWHPEKLAQHVAHLNRESTVGVSFSRSAFIDEEGNALNIYQMPKLDGITVEHLMCRNPVGNGSAPVIRRPVFEAIAFDATFDGNPEKQYFDESFRQSEDIECWIRIAATTQWQFAGLSDALTFYRINSASLSADIPKQLATWEAVMHKLESYDNRLWKSSYPLARAYQLRYLARQAIRQQDGQQAVALCDQALRTNPSILIREPTRTLLTIAAALVIKFIPSWLYGRMEPAGLFAVGATQRLRMAVK